jgi:tetratricopeptide repeat protein
MSADTNSLNQGANLAKEGRYDEAIEVFDRILATSPDDPEALFLLGACHFKKGNNDEARSRWERVLQIQPSHEKAKKMLARLPASGGVPEGLPASPETAPPAKKEESAKTRKGRGWVKWIVILAVLLVGAGIGADMYVNPNSYSFLRKERSKLEWKWNAGEVLKYRWNVDLNLRMSFEGTGMPMPENQDVNGTGSVVLETEHHVVEVSPSGVAEIDLKYKRVKTEAAFPGQPPKVYDSGSGRRSGVPDADKFVKDLTGATYRYQVDRNGKVLSAKGYDPIFSELAEKSGKNPMAANLPQE